MLNHQNLGVNQANHKTLAAKGLAPSMTGRAVFHVKRGMESSVPQHRPSHSCLSVHWRSVDGNGAAEEEARSLI